MTPIERDADRLLDTELSPGEQLAVIHRLFDGLSELIGFDDDEPTEEELRDTWVDGGRAISPREAARCLREYARTTRFMRAVHAAIGQARQRFPGERIEVLYAGCGPFAPLVLPLAHHWAADEVRYTLLDIHARSLAAAGRIAAHLGLETRCLHFVQTDASTYRIEGPRPHILVTETMTQGLQTETQVAICRNLVPRIHPDGFLIPERIDLIARLHQRIERPPSHDGADSTAVREHDLGPVMRLDKGNADRGGECFTIAWPERPPRGCTPMLHTHITVFGDIHLGDRDCSLNLPIVLPMPDEELIGARIRYDYTLTPKPGLVAHWEGDTWRPAPTSSKGPADLADQADASLKLPHRFDADALLSELSALRDADWSDHPNRNDYEGAWRSLALRSPSGRSADVSTASDDPGDYHDTDALRQSPALAAVLAALPGRVSSARLLSLTPGARIREHRDRGTCLWDGMARLHVPIQTDPRVDFRIGGERLDMRPGECWYLNANAPHSVHNGADIERVHLVVDCVVDDADTEQFIAWGHARQPPSLFEDPHINPDNIADVISNLESLGGETGMALAARLRTRAAASGIALT
ncbi:MAG: aspartyl/asparaginyl beta-hydroxylase domain-containing protein [Gammaproteobacteria bacterium]